MRARITRTAKTKSWLATKIGMNREKESGRCLTIDGSVARAAGRVFPQHPHDRAIGQEIGGCAERAEINEWGRQEREFASTAVGQQGIEPVCMAGIDKPVRQRKEQGELEGEESVTAGCIAQEGAGRVPEVIDGVEGELLCGDLRDRAVNSGVRQGFVKCPSQRENQHGKGDRPKCQQSPTRHGRGDKGSDDKLHDQEALGHDQREKKENDEVDDDDRDAECACMAVEPLGDEQRRREGGRCRETGIKEAHAGEEFAIEKQIARRDGIKADEQKEGSWSPCGLHGQRHPEGGDGKKEGVHPEQPLDQNAGRNEGRGVHGASQDQDRRPRSPDR